MPAKNPNPAASQLPSPFRFGFFFGLGFVAAQVFVVMLVVVLGIVGSDFAYRHLPSHVIPSMAVDPAPNIDRAAQQVEPVPQQTGAARRAQ